MAEASYKEKNESIRRELDRRYERPVVGVYPIGIVLLTVSETMPSAGDVDGPGFREEGYSVWDEGDIEDEKL